MNLGPYSQHESDRGESSGYASTYKHGKGLSEQDSCSIEKKNNWKTETHEIKTFFYSKENGHLSKEETYRAVKTSL